MSNLTEQWKKEELEKQKSYYIKYNEFPSFIAKLCEDNIFYGAFTDFEDEADGIQVLEPVPSYEEYMSLVFYKEDLTKVCKMKDKIIKKYEDTDDWWKKENQQLKQLLKECKSSVLFEADVMKETSGKHSKDYKMLANIITKIDNAIGEKK